MTSVGLAEPALTGRESEIEKLEYMLDLALKGKGTTVLVSGEAGAGKTRLTTEFLKLAKKKDVVVLAGWCLSDAAVPYFPFVEALNTYFSYSNDDESLGSTLLGNPTGVVSTIPMVGADRGITAWLTSQKYGGKIGSRENLSPQVWKDQVFAGVSGTLHDISVQTPVILFIEDLHWADSASLALLHYLARVVNASEKIFILGTYRTEGLTSDSEGHMHPLIEEMRLMRREDLFKEIKLEGLSKLDIVKIAENMLGGPLDDVLVRKLEQESRGNSLFVVESIRMLKERRGIFEQQGIWYLAEDAIGIPSKIKDIVLQRIAPLKFNQRRALDAASVVGEKFRIELLSAVLGLDSLEVLETLNTIMQTTSLLLVEEESYRFDHARSREILYKEMPIPLRRGYHARIAEKLENAKNCKLPLSDLAFHYAQAGNKEKCLKYSLAAAKDELANFSNRQAIEHFSYVLRNVAPDNIEEKRVALEGLGDAYCANSMYNDAIKTFDQLAAQEAGALKLHALRKAMDAAFLKGDRPTLLLEYAKKAEPLAEYDRLEMARVINNRSRAFGWSGQADGKLDLHDSEAALKVFEEENSIADMGNALWRSGVVSTMYNNLRERGLGKLALSVEIFKELGDVRKEVEATLYAGVGFSLSALFKEGNAYMEQVIKLGRNLDVFLELAQACTHLGEDAERRENMDEALSYFNKALEYCVKTDAEWLEVIICCNLARHNLKFGNLENASKFLDRINKSSEESRAHLGTNAIIGGVKAAYLFAQGQNVQFDEIFNPLFKSIKTESRGFQFPGFEIRVRSDYVWFLEKQGRFQEAEVQKEKIKKLSMQIEESFAHPLVQTYLMVARKCQVGQKLEMCLRLINISRNEGKILRVEKLSFSGLKISEVDNGTLELYEKSIKPFQVLTLKIKFEAVAIGSYQLEPIVTYKTDLGEIKTSKPDPITIEVSEKQADFEVLPGRIPTGFDQLDRLLLGGIPENKAVALAMSSCDERQKFIKSFLETGVKANETTIYITCEASSAKDMADPTKLSFIIVCNNEIGLILRDAPNIIKLKGVENLTDIDIALIKFLRTLKVSNTDPKRALIDILSDVLLQHHAVVSRKWLSSLLLNLKSKSFTTIATIDPHMHPTEELQALLSLFDGEIIVAEKETAEGQQKTMRIKRLYNQKYSKDEVSL